MSDEIVSALVGSVSGGLVSYFIARKALRDGRQELNASAALEALESSLVEARAYWRTSGQHPDLERRIKGQIDALSFRLRRAFPSDADCNEFVRLVNSFDECATGGTFEQLSRRRDPARLQRLVERANAIREAIETRQ